MMLNSEEKGWLRLAILGGLFVGVANWTLSSLNKAVLASGGAGQAAHSSAPAAPPVGDTSVDWSIFLPDGEGRIQTSIYCSNCHTVQVIAQRRSDESGWTGIVQRMIHAHSAAIQAEDADAIAKYLGVALSPTTPKLDLPIHINAAPKEVLSLLGELSADDIQKLMDARAKGKIQNFNAFVGIVGADKAAKYKMFLAFD